VSATAPLTPQRRLAGLYPAALLAIASLIILPVFTLGLACSHDAFIHLSRAAEVYFNARGGSPFLLWSPDLMRGYGHPVLAFYSPLVYWLLAAPHWLGVSFAGSFRALAYLALPAGGIGLYLLARRYLSPAPAFVAGLTYLFAPYLLFDAIQRGALPEAIALAGLPYCLAAVGAAARRRTVGSVVLAALALSALISTHNLVPLFAVPLCLLIAIFEGLSADRRWALPDSLAEAWRGGLAGGLAVGLAVIVTTGIWLPAIVEVHQTLTGQPSPPASPDLSNWPRYYANFIPASQLASWPAEPGDPQLYNAPISRSLGLVPAVLAGLAALAMLLPSVWRRYPVLAALAVAAIVCLYLSSQPSRWLWDHSAMLQTVQLPTRFLGPANIGVALLCGLLVELCLARLSHPAARAAVIALPAVAIAVCGWPWLFPRYCTPPAMATPAGIAQPQPPNDWMYEPLGELLPQWVQSLPPEKALTDLYAAGKPVNRLSWSGSAVTQQDWQTRPGYDRYVLAAAQPASLTYQTFYFPGWQATLDGQPIPLGITSPDGLMLVNLPAGTHVLVIAFRNTPLRSLAWIISAAGLLLCLLAFVAARRRRLSPSSAGAAPAVLASTTAVLLLLYFVVLPHFNTPLFGSRLAGERLAGVEHPASITFEKEVRYLGYGGPRQVAADQDFSVVQYWKAEHKLGVPYAFALRVADDQGHSWNLQPDRPFDFADYQGSEGWPANAYLRDAFILHLLPGTPPGSYWLEVSVYRRDVSLQLTPEAGTPTGPDPAWARVGQIQVTPPSSSALPALAAVDVVRPTALGGGLALAGWSVPQGTLHPGDLAHVTLLWQSSQPQPAGLTLDAQLTGPDGQALASFALSPGGAGYPLATWPAAALVRDQLDWLVPAAAGTGAYHIVVRSAATSADLGPLQVVAPAHRYDPPPAATPFDQAIGFARLTGYTLSSANPRPGDKLSLELIWQATAGATQSFRVFVHVRDAAGKPIAQSDAAPADWQRPTTGWVPGEYIVDPHSLQLPPDTPSGSYSLVVGLYNPADGQRLGEVTLASLTVK
jgi:hypothetical protein